MHESFWLIPIALLTSTLSGITGIGGGSILIGFMGQVFSPSILIPAHGLVQLTSNASRVYFSIAQIRLKIIIRYFLGAVIGACLGFFLVVKLPEQTLWLSIAGFLLLTTWMPKNKFALPIPHKYPLLGAVSTFLALFVGVTGPLIHPVMLREGLEKDEFIGTEAACSGITHLLKIVVFSTITIDFILEWRLILGMGIAAAVGSYVGKRLLKLVPVPIFRLLIRLIVTALAVRMIFISGLFS